MAANWISLGFHDDDMITLFATIKNIAATYASESVKVALDLVLPSVSLVQGVLGFI